MIYNYLKPLLFLLPPEIAHSVALTSLQLAHTCRLTSLLPTLPKNPKTVFGLTFPNPIGLAAGLDKNADYIDALGSLGFGFIEIGTLTPKPQAGNPKPRLFRYPEHEAIINRMGFNNKGVDYAVKRLQKKRYEGILGINIGKNRDTPNEKALDDYRYAFQKLSPFASYITINISSPNTKGLRDLQAAEQLSQLLSALKNEQHLQSVYKPLLVKISPDLTESELREMADVFRAEKIDGVIAANTTTQRFSVVSNEAGGLSGQPLAAISTNVIRLMADCLGETIPVIGVGGVMDVKTAEAKFEAGAVLLQVYSGLIYSGVGLIPKLTSIK